MYLKSLQLVGFKSFAEKTELQFLPGVTAIVGPNGCGKSNIADAIRWVLGEQSAKALRGSEMADVIFSGTDGRRAIGMAEVAMTFADCDPRQLSMPGVNLDFNEITISRRVYRDGQGEYFINKTPCRLRDIQSLFMDTGIGRSSYSLMAQGQIDQILSAHPEDRRNIFEEAAGINKYKHQKKEALRKLEYTEANLVRITDIIKEVKRQIISLQRQAGKARRYKELFDQLKALDTKLARHKFDLLQAEITESQSQIASIATRTNEHATQIADKEQQIADLRRSLAEIERTINDAVRRDHELKSEADRHTQRIATNTERIAEAGQLIENHRRETAASEEKIHIQEQELTRLNAEFAQIDSVLAGEQDKLRQQQDALRSLDADLTGKTRAANDAKSALMELESRAARQRNELAALDQKKKYDVVRAERLSTERLQIEEQRRALQQRLESYNTGLVELRAAVRTLRATLADREPQLTGLASELSAAGSRHHALVTKVSQQRARLDVLRQFFAAPDGHATLAGILDVEPQYGPAIEAALNHNLRTILADDLDAAQKLMANHPVTAPGLGSLREPSSIGHQPSAFSVVRVRDERFQSLVRSLLANVVIAGNLDEALALRRTQAAIAVATLAGEFVDEHGILSAVSTSHIGEISALADEVARLEAEANAAAAGQTELEQKEAALDAELAGLRGELHAKEVALAGKEGELNTLATEGRDLDSKVHTVVFELQAIEQQDAEEKQRRQEILAGLQQAEAQTAGLQEQLATAQQAVTELQSRREQMTQVLTELRVSVGGIEHKRRAIESQREPIAARVRDLRERIEACANETTSLTGKIEQFRQEIAESEARIGALATEREQSHSQLAGLQHQRDEVATGIEHAEEELRQLRRAASEVQQQKSRFEVQLAQKRMEAQNLKERVWQKYQVNVEDVRPDVMTVTVADSGPAISEQVPLATDWDVLEAQVAEMQTKLDAMGPVNVEAIQEFDELEQRHQHLSQQHEDLVKAKAQLLQIIAKINATTKQLFSETFEKVRQNFQGMFTELFGGGKANLILLDENDPLESGIEIVAKPPGKQLQSITLLSGGERTLTATALLFSIYMVKPSPFCVLDELDAPLDESNINRFIRILQRFITLSQFVVITHNKRTIGMADALYGITMEEHGISKVVSVKFSPREETERKALEKSRETQEDRIDGSAFAPSDGASADKAAYGLRPHEEELRNDLLAEKEEKVAPVADAPAVQAETAPVLSAAPAPIADEVKAAVEAAKAANESVKEIIEPEQPPA